MKINATIAAVIAIIAVALSGCSSTSAQVPQPEAAQQPSASNDEALQYLSSKERDDLYRRDFTVAANLIAHALIDGKFGPVEKFGADKRPLQPGYTGWGLIRTASHYDNADEQASVYWNADGSIDYSKGFLATSIRSVIDPKQSVHIATPRPEPPVSNWQASLTGSKLDGPLLKPGIDRVYIGDTVTGLHMFPITDTIPTATDLRDWDETALRLLDELMCEHFGEKWKLV